MDSLPIALTDIKCHFSYSKFNILRNVAYVTYSTTDNLELSVNTAAHQ